MNKYLKIALSVFGVFTLFGILAFGYLYYIEIVQKDLNVTVSNVTYNSATLTWVSKDASPAIAVVSESKTILPIAYIFDESQYQYDDRDYSAAELENATKTAENIANSSTVGVTDGQIVYEVEVTNLGSYYTHHVTVKGLNPETEYNFMVGEDNIVTRPAGENSLMTSSIPEDLPVPIPSYGVVSESGESISDQIDITDGYIYMYLTDDADKAISNTLSASISFEGSWYMDLSSFRSIESDEYFDRLDIIDGNKVIGAVNSDGTTYEKIIDGNIIAPADPFVLLDIFESNYEGSISLVSEVNASSPSVLGTAIGEVCSVTYTETGAYNSGDGCDYNCKSYGHTVDTIGNCQGEWGPGSKCTKSSDCGAAPQGTQCIHGQYCAGGNGNAQDCTGSCVSAGQENTGGGSGGGSSSVCSPGTCGARTFDCKENKTSSDSANDGCWSLCIDIGGGAGGWQHNSSCRPGVAADDGGGGDDGGTNVCCKSDSDGQHKWRTSCTSGYETNVSSAGSEADCNALNGDSNVCCKSNSDGQHQWSASCTVGYETNVSSAGSEVECNALDGSGAVSNYSCCKSDFDDSHRWGLSCRGYESPVSGISSKPVCLALDGSVGACCRSTTDGFLSWSSDGCSSGFAPTEYAREYCPLVTSVLISPGVHDDLNDARASSSLSTPPANSMPCSKNGELKNGFLCTDIGTGTAHVWRQVIRYNQRAVIECEGKCVCEGLRTPSAVSVWDLNLHAIEGGLCDDFWPNWDGWSAIANERKLIGTDDLCVLTDDEKKEDGLYKGCYCTVGGFGKNNVDEGDYCSVSVVGCLFADSVGSYCNSSGTKICKENRQGVIACLPITSAPVSTPETYTQVLGANTESVSLEEADYKIKLSPSLGVYIVNEPGEYCFTYDEGYYCFDALASGEYSVSIDSNNDGVIDENDIDLGATAVELNVSTITSTQAMRISTGMNLISFEIVSDDMGYMASDVLEYLNGEYSDSFYSIATFDAGKWNVLGSRSGADFASNDFQIIPGKGYLLKSKRDLIIQLRGNRVIDPVPVQMNIGWNLVATHGSDTQYSAESWIDSIGSVGDLTAINVTRWESDKARYDGLQKEADESGVFQVYGFDFPIYTNKGYFVRIDQGSGIWSPE